MKINENQCSAQPAEPGQMQSVFFRNIIKLYLKTAARAKDDQTLRDQCTPDGTPTAQIWSSERVSVES